MNLRVLITVTLTPLLIGCGGYTELPVPTREVATMSAESLDLHPGALGLLQLAVDLPEDVDGPLFVISEPWIAEPDVTAVSWAEGPCPSLGADTPPASWRACVTLYAAAGAHPGDFHVDVVLDATASGRRFTVTAEVEVP